MTRNRKSSAIVAALVTGLLMLGAASAEAATRYAAPGGTGAAPCADPQQPCSLFVAADQSMGAGAGDEVVLAPGEYVDQRGELGPFSLLRIGPGVDLHGKVGAARPVIVFVVRSQLSALAGVSVSAGATVSHIRIENLAVPLPLSASGTVEDVVVRSDSGATGAVSCNVFSGLLRDSVCISRGAGETALGFGFGILGSPTGTATIRNVTAISTGPQSFGLRYRLEGLFGTPTVNVDAKAVIAKGVKTDVGAFAEGAIIHIVLDHSDYRTVSAEVGSKGGVATVTPAGSGTNIEAEPLLASDGIHQLPDSPTVDAGVADAASGAEDLDGQPRTIGAAPDIGVDEATLPTTTDVSCEPDLLRIDETASCSATVANAGGRVDPPRGAVEFHASSHGPIDGRDCDLEPLTESESSCQLTYEPSRVGTDLIVAEYSGDGAHDRSGGLTALSVLPPPDPRPPRPAPRPDAPDTRISKQPRRKSSKRLVKFAFTSDLPGSSFECSLDRKPFRPCISPFKAKVRPGSHTFRVRAVSPDDVPDPSPAVFHWRVLKA